MTKQTVYKTSARQDGTSIAVGVMTVPLTLAAFKNADVTGVHAIQHACMNESSISECDTFLNSPTMDAAVPVMELSLSIIAGYFASRVAANLMGNRTVTIIEQEDQPMSPEEQKFIKDIERLFTRDPIQSEPSP